MEDQHTNIPQSHIPQSQDMSPPPDLPSLDELRKAINEVDEQLILALSRRASLVVQVGEVKKHDGTPVYAPHREQEVLRRVLARNDGPLSDRTLEAIYRELMSGSFVLELGMRVGFNGPAGSFSHMAAVRHFGSSVEFNDVHSIEGVFEEVAKGHVNYGLVPYENSQRGGMTDTLDAFQEFDVQIYAEALVEIVHCLLANCPPDEIERIYSEPQVFDHCRRWLSHTYPDVELVAVPSSAEGVLLASETPATAAIGSAHAGEVYGVNRIYEKLDDKPNNITRFLIIGNQCALPSKDDKTTIMFATSHKPGALVDVLAVFRDRDINLSHIEKRPSGKTNWEYTFFIDCEGHHEHENMKMAIEEAGEHCLSVKVLGSYPRATRVL